MACCALWPRQVPLSRRGQVLGAEPAPGAAGGHTRRAAASFTLDDRDQRMVHGSDETKSALDIFVKDLGLVLDAAHANSYPAPLASAAEHL